ncbi:MAG: CHRD domain-containing protein, partial [Alphaproteobacteria bacterium]|nr:CHRD domain-containing protein [Alphaproteobacteria bacterium]
VWSERTLNRWITGPGDFIPGNRMSFGGLSDPDDGANLIAYLRAQSTAGAGADAGGILAFQAALASDQTVPEATPFPGARGRGTVLLNTETNEIGWVIDFTGLSGGLGAIHFHGPAPAGSPADVLLDIGAISGLDGPLIGTAELTEKLAKSLRAGEWYINLHTELNPPGELRGQLVP